MFVLLKTVCYDNKKNKRRQNKMEIAIIILIFLLIFSAYIFLVIYECIVCKNIIKACNIYLNKRKEKETEWIIK